MTSTDYQQWLSAANLVRLPPGGALPQLPSQSGLELGHGAAGMLLPQCRQLRVAGVTLGVPLVGETTRGDVVDQSPHRGGEVEVVVLAPPGELPVLARRRVVPELRRVSRLAHEPHRPLDFAGED